MSEQRFSVTSMLRSVRRGIASGNAEVPCNGCVACCRCGYAVQLEADELADPRLKHDGGVLLKQDNGACIHLIDGEKCEVYAARPRQCRAFDCRVMALGGLIPGDSKGDKSELRAAIDRNTAACKTREDAETLLALRLAASVADQNIADPVPETMSQFAVLHYETFIPEARQLYKEFLALPKEKRAEVKADLFNFNPQMLLCPELEQK